MLAVGFSTLNYNRIYKLKILWRVMGNIRNSAGLVALTLGLSFVARGATIYDNGVPNQFSGTQMSDFVVAEDFTVSGTSNISNIRFWSIQALLSDYLGSVYWAIYSDAASQPAVILQGGFTTPVTAMPTGAAASTVGGYAEYVFDIPVTFQLVIGNYWLALHNGPLATNSGNEMLWATTGSGNGSEALYNDGVNGWVGSGNELAFRVDGTAAFGDVPEPGTFGLLAGGLTAAALIRRRT